MSSILDALKKSEAERQRGLPPTLNSPAAFHRTRAERSQSTRWWLPAAALAGVAIAWWMGVFDFGNDSTTTGAATQAEAVAPIADIAEPAPAPSDSAAAPPATTDAAPPAVTAVEPAIPEPAAVTQVEPAAGANRPRRVGFGPFPRQPSADTPPAAGSATAPADAPVVATVPAPVPEFAPVLDAPAPAGVTPGAAGTEPAVPASATSTQPAAVAEPAPAPAPSRADGVPTIFELPFAARRALPEIAVTMHMYSADPARRFALINGVRAKDGESIDGGIEVVRILPDGVQLRIEGTEFVLPVSN
jgi:general secretion pathway protein B